MIREREKLAELTEVKGRIRFPQCRGRGDGGVHGRGDGGKQLATDMGWDERVTTVGHPDTGEFSSRHDAQGRGTSGWNKEISQGGDTTLCKAFKAVPQLVRRAESQG